MFLFTYFFKWKFWASLLAQTVKNLPAVQETWVDPWVGKMPWRRAWQPTPVFLPGESPWTEEPGGLQSMGLQRVRYNLATENKNRREVETWMKVREGMESPPSSLLAAVGGEQISLS